MGWIVLLFAACGTTVKGGDERVATTSATLVYDCNSQVAIAANECAALISLYNSTDGDNWTDNTNWGNPDPSTWFGVTVVGGTVVEVNLFGNNLAGNIPNEVGDLPNLEHFRLQQNALVGVIPSQLGQLSQLRTLDVNGNQLTGTLPRQLAALSLLDYFDCSTNQIEGGVPRDYIAWAQIQDAYFDDNLLYGVWPEGFDDAWTNLSGLTLSNNLCFYAEHPLTRAWLDGWDASWRGDCAGDYDNDGVNNASDLCAAGDTGWTSTPAIDHDSDGCRDATEDDDDDNDRIDDSDDSCPLGAVGTSVDYDHDSDGCEDDVEDNDDDNDGITDSNDGCPRGEIDWANNGGIDADADGCEDGSEDYDDDDDGVFEACASGTGAVDATVEKWQATDFIAVQGTPFRIAVNSSSNVSVVAVDGPLQGRMAHLVSHGPSVTTQATIEGYRYNSSNGNYLGFNGNVITTPSWTGLSGTGNEQFLNVTFGAFIDSNNNGKFDSGVDHYIRKLSIDQNAGEILEEKPLLPNATGRLYLAFQDGPNYPSSNAGVLSFNVTCTAQGGDQCPQGMSSGTDTDGDGCKDDGEDTDDDNDGVDDASDNCPLVINPRQDDIDGDGIGDACDTTDSDDDGLEDAIEIENGTNPYDGDSDDDGVLDGQEADWNIDSDGDGLINALDADSDNDALLDGTERGITYSDLRLNDTNLGAGAFRPDSDGGLTTTDPRDADTDGGGTTDAAEDTNLNGTVDSGETDPNDGSDDIAPQDSDGDGLSDTLEGILGTSPSDADSDDDGIIDSGEPNLAIDTDGDGKINALDPDSDNDGILDGTERGFTSADPDTDLSKNRFIGDADPTTQTSMLLPDTDGGGLADGVEDCDLDGALGGSTGCLFGIGDVERNPLDPSDDVSVDNSADSDSDTIPDVIEGPGDFDDDGTANYLDNDSDADSIPDLDESAQDLALAPPDTDATGLPDYLDIDADNDNLPDAVEGQSDADGDGVPNFIDLDADGDGIADAFEAMALEKGLERPVDSDNDGIFDYLDDDADGDTILDRDELASAGRIPNDQDGDGIFSFRDDDSDGDGLPDALEAGDDDPNSPPVNSDGSGLPDFLDTDSDNDGVDDGADNCRVVSNPGQEDGDDDGIGTACDDDEPSGGGCASAGEIGLALAFLVLVSHRRRRFLNAG